MAVNWLLGTQQGPDPGQRFQMGFQHAQDRQRDEMLFRQHQDQMEMQRRQAKNEDHAAQQRQITEAAQTLGPIYQQLQQMPYEQRRGWLQQVAPRLTARGIPPQIIAEYDPTDQNLQADIALSQRAQQQQPTTLQRDYEWLRQNHPDRAGPYLQSRTEPQPRYITRPDGSVGMVLPPAAEGGDDEWDYSPAQGGPSPGGSGNFR